LPTAFYLPHCERQSRDGEEKEAPFFRTHSHGLSLRFSYQAEKRNIPLNKYQR
jgi:hypothetical protein